MTYMKGLEEEDRQMFAAAIERLATEFYSIERCRADTIECSPEEWGAFGAQGLFAIGIDAEYGGLGGGARDLAMVTRQVGRNLLPLPFMDTVVIGASLIGALGSDDQKATLLGRIAQGRLRLSFAHRETDAGDARDLVATTVRDGRLNGEKMHAMDARLADIFIVSARDETGVIGLFLVTPETSGVSCQHYRLVDNRVAARVTLEDAVGVPLGGNAASTLSNILDLAAACGAAESVGAMEGVNRATLDYAKIRKQFGVSIGSFQVLQHRMVDMFIAEQTASALVADALAAIDAGDPDAAVRISAAKAQADRAARVAGEQAIQIHGGMGMTDECAVGHYLKRILTNGSQFGTAGWHVDRIAGAAL